MTAISITPGYPNYSDTDGSPLNDGYVYIGLEYQNPITAPTGAFWDQDFQIPADQPLRTSGGYIVRDGSPAAVYTGAAYSILVQNKNLVTVYNAPSAVITNVTNTVEDITQYQGAHATDPLARNDGTPLQVGDLYFNTSINELKVWTGSVWAATSPGNVAVQNFTGTGSQTAFTLSAAPIAENNTQIYIDGVYQQKDTYAVSGATINFSTAPPNLSTIEVVSFSIASLGTVDSSNVSYNQGGTGAVNQSVQSKLQESVSVKDFGAVGDGSTDDTAAIQAAIDAVSATGTYGEVIIPPSAGEYIFTSIQNKTKVTLKGTGGILKYKDNTAVDSGVSYYLIYNLTGEKVTYEGLIIEGNKANNTAFTVADAITCTGFAGTVRDCRIFNPPDSGIMFSDANRGQCVGNYVEAAPDAGIYVNGTLVADPSSSDSQGALVAGNVIKSCVFNGIVLKRGCQDVSVDANTVFDCGNGIGTESFTGGNNPWNISITNNQIFNIGYMYRSSSVAERGIDLQMSDNCVVSGNRVHEVGGVALNVSGGSNNTVDGNVFTGHAASPDPDGQSGFLYETRESSVPSYNIITNNQFENFTGWGMYLRQGTNTIIQGNIIKGVAVGIEAFVGAYDNMILDNILSGSTADFNVAAASNNNLIEGNKKINSTGTGANGFTATSTELNAAANAMNTSQFKEAGFQVYNSTLSKPVFAAGAAATDVWKDAAGTTANTPV